MEFDEWFSENFKNKKHDSKEAILMRAGWYAHLDSASRESRTLCDVPSEEEMRLTREWWVNENKDCGDCTKDELWNISEESAEVLIKYHNYRMSRRHVV